uniref:DUF1081 domain-containing protein n=1 Tax=Rhodnius prolixus TaxID=13249 RepID=T1IE11_RHOPR
MILSRSTKRIRNYATTLVNRRMPILYLLLTYDYHVLKQLKLSNWRPLPLKANAAVEVRGDFVVDGLAFEEGVKVAINLHTSTGSDLTFRVLDGRGVDVKFGLPVKKQDVLSVSTDVATVIKKKNSPEHVVPVVFDVKREKYVGCFDQLSEVLGVTVCGKVDVPWEGHRSILPSYGPSKLSLQVDKDDDSLTYYHFKVYADEKEGVSSFELLFDTPNSRKTRKVALNVEGSLSDKTYLKLDLKSPWTNALFDAALILNKQELSFNVKFIHDDVEYYLRTGAVKSQQGNVVKFEPVLEYKAPEQTKSALIGRRGGPKHSAQVITLTGAVVVETLENEKKWKFESLALNTPKTKYSIDGTGTTTPHGFDLDVVAHYDKEHVKIKGNFKRKDKNGYNQLTVLPSQYPDFNLNAKWDYYYDPVNGKYESKLNVIHGTDPNSATNKLFVHNKLDLNKKDNHYGTENTVTYPLVNLDGHVGFRVTEKSLKTELRGKFDKYSAQLLVQGEINTKKEGDYNAEIRWEFMGNSVALTSSRKVLKNHQSKFINVLEVKPGGKYELRVHATHKHNKDDLDYSADVDLLLPADPKNVKLKAGLKHNNVETKGHLNAVAGSKQYLQSDFSVKPGDKPSGAFKVKVPDYVFAQGDFLFDGTNFKSKSKIELPKVQKQLDGKANFVVSNSKYSGSAELCWEAGNPEKTLQFQTDTVVQDNSVASANVLVFAGKKTVLNLQGGHSGNEEKSKLEGELEFVLPNGDRVVFKSSDYYDFTNIHDAIGEGEVELTLQKSGKEPLKVSVKGITKNVDVERLNFDGQFTLYVVTPEKKELNSHLVLKKAPKGEDKWLVKGEFAVTGNLVDRPVTFKLDSEVPTELFDDSKDLTKLPPLNYHLSFNAGSDVHLESNGKVGGNILSGDLTAKLPQDSPVTSVKWVTSNFVDLFNDDNKYKVKASNELHWNNENFIKVSGEANCEPNGLNYVAEWETNELSKRKLSGAAHCRTSVFFGSFTRAAKSNLPSNLSLKAVEPNAFNFSGRPNPVGYIISPSRKVTCFL